MVYSIRQYLSYKVEFSCVLHMTEMENQREKSENVGKVAVSFSSGGH